MLIGVISDTHNVFHHAIPQHFAGVQQILHAGDIGNVAVMTQLEQIAPVIAVTGNIDWGRPLDQQYPRIQRLDVEGCAIYMTHIGDLPDVMIKRLPEPRPQVYICGHSHIPIIEQKEDVLFLNPGSAGPPRFGRRPSIALLTIENGVASAELILLSPNH
jgi:putative phosphoesterase